LNDCPSLTEIDCAKNDFFELDFLSSADKLKVLKMKNNQKLSLVGLRYLSHLEELEKLDLSNCPLEGSLKPLQSLNKLAELDISNTNLSEGLEHLPSSCKKLYCNSDYHCKSIKIMEELEKSNCSENEGENKHYIPSK
jgi:Leucine-rich repeat (LRR) protein